MVLKTEEFLMRELIDQINIIINGQCLDKGLHYECQIVGGINDYYVGDDMKLKQVIINILGNSVKFTPAPGDVLFKIEQIKKEGDDCTLRFTMRDTGIGMDKEYIPKIFEAFSQEDATTTNKYGGSGLGMAITKNFVEMMNGKIDVESEKGVGSTFTVTVNLKASERKYQPEAGMRLPEGLNAVVADDDAKRGGADDIIAKPLFSDSLMCRKNGADLAKEPDVPEEAGENVLAGKRVLMAEDVDANAEILADLLDLEEIESERAENGEIAISMFLSKPAGYYDAVLMDVRMPVMDGLTATATIRANDREDAKTVPIIAMTANVFDEDVERSRQAGMNAHLSKPIEPDKLYAALVRFISENEKQKNI